MNKRYAVASFLVLVTALGAGYWYTQPSDNSRLDEVLSRDFVRSVPQEDAVRVFSDSGSLMLTDADAVALKKTERGKEEVSGYEILSTLYDNKYGDARGDYGWFGEEVVFIPHIPCDHGCPSNPPAHILSGVDPDRFVVYRWSSTGGELSANPGVTSYFVAQYGKNDRHVYYQNRVIADANPDTFEVYADEYGFATEYSRDNEHVFFEDQILKGEDPKTFSPST